MMSARLIPKRNHGVAGVGGQVEMRSRDLGPLHLAPLPERQQPIRRGPALPSAMGYRVVALNLAAQPFVRVQPQPFPRSET